jgi:hypothetical protein
MKVNIQKLWTLVGGSWTLTIEAWRLKIEPWSCKPVAADSHSFDKEQAPDPDPDLYLCERIRNRI